MAFRIYSIVLGLSFSSTNRFRVAQAAGGESLSAVAPINCADAGADRYSPITLKASTEGKSPSSEPTM